MRSPLQWFRNWWSETYATEDESDSTIKWFSSQYQSLQAGEEIEPPWKVFPDCAFMDLGPMWGGWRQGNSEGWIKSIWYPFWKGLSKEDRAAYLTRWEASEDWRVYLEPDRETSSLANTEKESIAGHVLNLWLMGDASDIARASAQEERPKME